MSRYGEGIILVLLGIPSALIDWQIAQTWHLPLLASLLPAALVVAAAAWLLLSCRLHAVMSGLAVAVLYALPVVGGIIRWRLVPSPVALIGDGAYQMQLARDVLMGGTDPYGFNYARTGMAHTPWSQPFPNPSLHHLDYWPGTLVVPLPLQVAFKALFGWWDERIWMLIAAVAIWIIIGRLAPGAVGRMAAMTLFLIPGHSLLAVLGDNDLSMIAWLLLAMLAMTSRRWLIAGLLIGVAIATKQTAIIALPVLVVSALARGIDRRHLLQATGSAAAVVILFLTPFVIWNAQAFVSDTILFNFGSGAQAYPIQGIGLGSLLLSAGIIHGSRDSFPFLAIQLPLVVAAWLAAWRWLTRHNHAGDVLVCIGVAFFVFFLTNRFTQQTYLLLSIELALAGLICRQERPDRLDEVESRSLNAA